MTEILPLDETPQLDLDFGYEKNVRSEVEKENRTLIQELNRGKNSAWKSIPWLTAPWQALGGIIEFGNNMLDLTSLDLEIPQVGAPKEDQGFIGGAAQFMIPGGVVFKGLKYAPYIKGGIQAGRFKLSSEATRGLISGAITDFFGATKQDSITAKPLKNFLETYPDLEVPLLDYLADRDNKTEVEGRLLNSLEGQFIGVTLGQATRVAPILMKTFKKMKEVAVNNAGLAKDLLDKLKVGELDGIIEITAEEAGMAKRLAQIGSMKEGFKIRDPEALKEYIELGNVQTVWNTNRPGQTQLSGMRTQDIKDAKEGKRQSAYGVQSSRIAQFGGGLDVNFDHMQTPKDIKDLFNRVAIAFKPHVDNARGFKSWDAVKAEAEDLGVDPSVFANLKEGPLEDLSANILAARLIRLKSAHHLQHLEEVASKSMAPIDLLAFEEHLARHGAIHAQVVGAQAEVARIMNSFKIPVSSKEAEAVALSEFVEAMGGFDTISAKMQKVRSTRNMTPQASAKVLRELGQKGWWARTRDALNEIYINGLLSRPVTAITNFGGNIGALSVRIMERQIASFMTKDMPASEAAQMLVGITEALWDAVGVSGRALWNDIPQTGLVKTDMWSQQKAITAENFGGLGINKDGNKTALGHFINAFGHITRMPSRLNMGMDEFFKVVNMRAEQRALAWRWAYQNSDNHKDFINKFESMMAQIGKGNKDFQYKQAAESIEKQSREFALSGVFASPIQQKQIKAVNQLRTFDKDGGVMDAVAIGGKVFLPFFSTPVNITKFSLERVPGVNLMMKKTWQDLAAGGPQRAQALAKMSTGLGLMTMGYQLAEIGAINGAAPSQIYERLNYFESGATPYSIVTMDGYAPFTRLDPFAMMLGWGADSNTLAQISGRLVENEMISPEEHKQFQEDMNLLQSYATAMASEFFTSRAYLQGMSELLSLAKVSINEDGKIKVDKEFKKAASRYIDFFNPMNTFYSGLRGGMARAMDEKVRSANSYEFWNYYFKQMLVRNPWLSKDAPPRYTWHGENIMHYTTKELDNDWHGMRPWVKNMLDPVPVKPRQDHPLMTAIRELKIRKQAPSRWVKITFRPDEPKSQFPTENVGLTDEEMSYWQKKATTFYKNEVTDMVTSAEFKALPVTRQREQLNAQLDRYKEMAKRMLIMNEDSPAYDKELGGSRFILLEQEYKQRAKKARMGGKKQESFFMR